MFNIRHSRVAGLGNVTVAKKLNLLFAIRTIQERIIADMGQPSFGSNYKQPLMYPLSWAFTLNIRKTGINCFDAAGHSRKKTTDYEFSRLIISWQRCRYFIKVPEFVTPIRNHGLPADIGIESIWKNEILYNIPPTPDLRGVYSKLKWSRPKQAKGNYFQSTAIKIRGKAKMLIGYGLCP